MTRARKAVTKTGLRDYGSGSISSYEVKSGTRWRYEILTPVDAARPELGVRRLGKAGFASEVAAEEALLLLRADLVRGVPQVVGRDTFDGYARRWLAGYSGSTGTALYIKRVVDAMEPYIGAMNLADIRATDLAAAYRGLENNTKARSKIESPRVSWRLVQLEPAVAGAGVST